MSKTKTSQKSKKPKRADRGTYEPRTTVNGIALAPELRERADDPPALKRARAAFLETLQNPEPSPAMEKARAKFLKGVAPPTRKSLARLISSPAMRKAFNEWRPLTSKLAAANAAFDAAILGAVKACIGCCATPRIRAGSRSKETLATVKSYEAAQDAGHALQETAAAIFRARAEEQPIPVKLTPKGKTAKLKPFHAVPSRRRSK